MNIEDKVYNYPTKHKEGFTHKEILAIAEEFPNMNKKSFWATFKGNTCVIIKGSIITYHCDIITALNCGIENRKINPLEFD